MGQVESRERAVRSTSGWPWVLLGAACLVGAVAVALQRLGAVSWLAGVALVLAGLACWMGLYMLQPNQAAVLQFFGEYAGTDRSAGLRWTNPLRTRRKVSVRVHNFNGDRLKVNDLRGNPIEIAAAVVWRVQDTARALFDVEDYEAYVRIQAEAAVRNVASRYAYDHLDAEPGATGTHEVTLRSGGEEVAAALRGELQARFAAAGVVVEDAKLTHLAYAPEIAGTMLRRQQAEAVVAARAKIVQGAVGMVEMALQGLEARGLVALDDERKAAMVSNLLVVLCGDRDATPVVNTGTLYG
ncbi:SPFH domain-containing protein [Ideonella sp. DXS22W]|uniref:SPFH domain-containing protein n=1 Tax=Pseudaquabacterium inlustre TaxID=2984192 RepID=A0ABU9CFI9_9BURK